MDIDKNTNIEYNDIINEIQCRLAVERRNKMSIDTFPVNLAEENGSLEKEGASKRRGRQSVGVVAVSGLLWLGACTAESGTSSSTPDVDTGKTTAERIADVKDALAQGPIVIKLSPELKKSKSVGDYLNGHDGKRFNEVFDAMQQLGERADVLLLNLDDELINRKEAPLTKERGKEFGSEEFIFATKKKETGGYFIKTEEFQNQGPLEQNTLHTYYTLVTIGKKGEPAYTFTYDDNGLAVTQTEAIPGTYEWGKDGIRVGKGKGGQGIRAPKTAKEAQEVDTTAFKKASRLLDGAMKYALANEAIK